MIFMLGGMLAVFAGGIVQFFSAEKNKAKVVSVFTGVGILPVIINSALVLSSGAEMGPPAAGVSMDGLSAFFCIVIAIMSFAAVLYSGPYMRMYEGRGMNLSSHFFFLPVLIVSMLGVAIARSAIVFLVSWELMALSSFFLVIFENEKKDVLEAGIYYLVMSHISVVLLMAGFALAGNRGLSFASIAEEMALNRGAAAAVFILMSAGFAVKAGIVPLHSWLPAAHPAAPSHISALMSGVMIKMGIYGFARLITLMPVTAMKTSYVVLGLGLISALLGMLYSMAQRDMKRVLAFSSIENMGIITAGMGLGLLGMETGNPYMAVLGFAGAFMHVFNHSVFKTLLFFGAGSVYQMTHTRDMEHLGGLGKKMPATAASFLAGSAAISGLPPFNGFAGEFLIYLAMIEAAKTGAAGTGAAGVLSLAALGLTGAMAIISFTRMYGIVFSGAARSEKADVKKAEDRLQSGIMTVLAAVCLGAGLIPQAVFGPALAAVNCMGKFDTGIAAAQLGRVSIIFLIITAATALLLAVKRSVLQYKTQKARTWGCAYDDVNPKMQYSAYSYAEPFLKLAEPMTGKQKEEARPEGFFPEKASYKARYFDMAEKLLLKPAAAAVSKALKMFSWIQSGSMQLYIIYGLIFLLFSIAWVLGGGK